MILKNKQIMIDLIDYLTNGIDAINGTPLNQDNVNHAYDSLLINDVKYKFITKYEYSESLPDDGTHQFIPVLIVQNTDLYKSNKRVLYKNRFVDLATLFHTSHNPSGYPTEKIHFYVVPFISSSNRNITGTIYYDLIIDYDSEYDVYGMMSKEINQIIMNHYYRERGNPHYEIVNSEVEMYFVPQKVQIMDNLNSRFHRIQQYYNIRVCEVR